MKQFVTIDTERDIVELTFSGDHKPIVINPKRLRSILEKYIKSEAEKLNKKLKKPLYGINDKT